MEDSGIDSGDHNGDPNPKPNVSKTEMLHITCMCS